VSRYQRANKSTPAALGRKAYRVPEVQEMFGIGRSTVYDLLKRGVLERVDGNGLEICLITAASVDRFGGGKAA
jgi:Helix-turn-helix domain